LDYEESLRLQGDGNNQAHLQIDIPAQQLDVAVVTSNNCQINQDRKLPFDAQRFRVVANEELCKQDDSNVATADITHRFVRHIELFLDDMDNHSLQNTVYSAADNLGIILPNSLEVVQRCAKLMNLDTSVRLRITNRVDSAVFSGPKFPETLQEILTWYVDLTSSVRPRVLRSLIPFTSSNDDKIRLRSLSDQSGEILHNADYR